MDNETVRFTISDNIGIEINDVITRRYDSIERRYIITRIDILENIATAESFWIEDINEESKSFLDI